jgi:hypothetical protein
VSLSFCQTKQTDRVWLLHVASAQRTEFCLPRHPYLQLQVTATTTTCLDNKHCCSATSNMLVTLAIGGTSRCPHLLLIHQTCFALHLLFLLNRACSSVQIYDPGLWATAGRRHRNRTRKIIEWPTPGRWSSIGHPLSTVWSKSNPKQRSFLRP